ncbi:hypothetical protein CRYUN_Cryun06bG0135900 [Craigia yunnanensis]
METFKESTKEHGDQPIFDYPATFDKLAMDPTLRKELIENLDRLVRRGYFFRGVGKAWKRGCGDERIVVCTTNHKDKLDPALLRSGSMDVHIHMSYCTPSGFRILTSRYLCITSHNLLTEIDELMMEVEVTPAEIAEELMKSEDADIALGGLIKFLQNKKRGSSRFYSEGENEDSKCNTNTGSIRKGKREK